MAEEKKQQEEEKITREDLYAKYDEQNGVPPAEEQTEKPPVAAEEKKDEVKEEVKEEVKQEPHGEHETVEKYKAISYEERMKRKAESDLRKAAEAKAEALEAKIRQYETQQAGDETITDYDREIINLKNKIRAIEETEQERGERERREASTRAEQRVVSEIDQAHKDLVSEGFYGFKHAIGSVTQELRRLVAEDESNISLDNPAGWKRIFKEKIFPDMQREAQEVEKKKVVDEKTKLKEQANLVGGPGKPLPKDGKKEPTAEESRAEYFAMRRGEK